MSNNSSDLHLILSDLHFGTEETSLNQSVIAKSLVDYMATKGPWRSVIFSGDLLDLNLSTFTISIEGKKSGGKTMLGFREFLKRLCDPNVSGLAVDIWIYIPGNHDYFIWNLLSTKEACTDVLAAGQSMRSVTTPLKEGTWRHGSAFISGVFPRQIRNKVTVQYPDHVIKYSIGRIVITHGHYLDPKQTLFKRLDKLIQETGSVKSAVRKMFIETAQYQAVANAVSYTPEMRKFVNYLFGPKSMAKKVRGIIARYVGDATNIFPVSPLRDEPINEGQLRAIEFYVRYFRNYRDAPDYFIFGHTHEQGSSSTSHIPVNKRLYRNKEIQVYNSGTFFPKRSNAATFITVQVPKKGNPIMIPVYITKAGKAVESNFS